LVEELSADRKTIRGSKKWGCPSSNDGAKILDDKQYFMYANENSKSKHCAVCSSRKITGGHRETVYYCATWFSKLDFILEFVLNYTTRR
jgi:hypothetical protein